MNHRALRSWSRNGHRVIDCANCGYCHLDPMPAADVITDFYRHDYQASRPWFGGSVLSDEQVAARRRKALARPDYARVLRVVDRHMRATMPRRMLDVGGGSSLLASCFVAQGWDCQIVEPNIDAAAYLRRFDLSVTEGMLNDVEAEEIGRFGFVNLHYVLEHVRDPLRTLQDAAALLADDGVLRVCVPNDFSPGQMAWLEGTDQEPPWIIYPDHINYFNFDSLVALLNRAGLQEVERTTSFPLEFLLLTGMDYYAEPAQRDRVGPAVRGFEQAWRQSGQEAQLDSLYAQLAGLGMGRSAEVYARLSGQ